MVFILYYNFFNLCKCIGIGFIINGQKFLLSLKYKINDITIEVCKYKGSNALNDRFSITKFMWSICSKIVINLE